jgi:hypothetical protein
MRLSAYILQDNNSSKISINNFKLENNAALFLFVLQKNSFLRYTGSVFFAVVCSCFGNYDSTMIKGRDLCRST